MTATKQAPATSTDTIDLRAAPKKPSGRVAGIDIARGLALLGMFTVHVSIDPLAEDPPGTIASWLLAAPAGQASVLFFILSGLSLSLVARRGSASARPGVLRRRGAVLVIGGLLLSATIWGASILEHYGVMFLLAPWMIKLSDRALTRVTAGTMAAGPPLLLLLSQRSFAVGEVLGETLGFGVVGWLWTTFTGLLLDGTYPLVVWTGFFLLGVRLGRLDLSSTRVTTGFLAGGIAVALAVGWSTSELLEVTGTDLYDGYDIVDDVDDVVDETPSGGDTLPDMSGLLTELNAGSITKVEFADRVYEAKFGSKDYVDDYGFDDIEFDDVGGSEFFDYSDFDVDRRPAALLDNTPHSGRTGWVLRSSAIAVAILGATLLLPSVAQRLLWPLAALGSISLTSYLLHIFLVTDGWTWLVGQEPTISTSAQLATLAGLQLAMVIVASLIKWRWNIGPAEKGLKMLTSGAG